jgi:protein-tyrosine phosphatase
MPTDVTVLDLPDAEPTEDVVRAAEAALAAGEVVAFPTETVYGLAARADDERALAALRELKGQPPGRTLTWHVGTPAALDRFPVLAPIAARLAERYWPGPLTLVRSLGGADPGDLALLAHDGWVGVRMPAHAGTAGVLARLPFPVAMTSANRHGEPPSTNAGEVRARFPERVPVLLDGGPARLGEASGVLAVGPERFELLREGLLPIDDLRRTAGLRLAFVCTGNTCRSPMAEGFARRMISDRLGYAPEETHRVAEFGFEVESMGLFASFGAPVSQHSVEVMHELAIDVHRHRSRPAVAEHVAELDRVYALTVGHLQGLRAQLPPGKAEHIELLDPAGGDVPDPIGGSRNDYRLCATHIRQLVEQRLDDWA